MLNPSFLKNCSKKLLLITGLLLLFPFWSSATDHKYEISTLPKELCENANTVVREKTFKLEVYSARKATLYVHYALTILNANSVEDAILTVPYNSFTRVSNLHGYVYSASGERVERIEKDKFFDISAIAGYSAYEDHRVKACRPKYQSVPFTVEYEFEIDYNGIFEFPDFYLAEEFSQAVEKARLDVSVPDSIGLRYFQRNITGTPMESSIKGRITYQWNFAGQKALRKEPFSPPAGELTQVVLLTPASYKIDRKWGSSNSWRDIGLFLYGLITGRDELEPETCQKVKKMVENSKDTLEMISVLYKYMQEKTRYVSIQTGIGGWQPEKAAEVDRLGYGDCKALTNYMKALLKAAGIPSFYTVVKAGKNERNIISGFPSNQFNHVILCVPVAKDTLWLECTSQDPAGFLGTFTDDRTVLIVKESGGYLAHTPVYDSRENHQERSVKVDINEDNSGQVIMTTVYSGFFYEDFQTIIRMDDHDKREKLTDKVNVSKFTLNQFELKETRCIKPFIIEKLILVIPDVTVKGGEVGLLTANQFTLNRLPPGQVLRRTHPFEIRRSYSESDTVTYVLPDGFAFSETPLQLNFSSEFGQYSCHTIVDGKTLRYVRTVTISKGCWKAESYASFLDFHEKINAADRKKVTFKSLKDL